VADFTEISKQYEKHSIIQKSASELLLDLLDIQDSENVLDLGCGTGHIARRLKEKTSGKVVGIDSASGMIDEANEKYRDEGISFRKLAVEQLDYQDEFDKIFCNSAFQWFSSPEPVLRRCYHALKPGGRMAIQAPAREIYCPHFIDAIESVKTDKSTETIFSSFTSPWFFLDTAEEYNDLFAEAGFLVNSSTIEKVVTAHSSDEVYKIFTSGAAAGYLNQAFYDVTLTEHYEEAFKKIVRDSFISQSDSNGKIALIFYRIYLLAEKGR